MSFCIKCGNKIENEAKFCSNCGTPVTNSNMNNNIYKTGTVIIYRSVGIQDIFRSYKIIIDNKEVGKIKIGEEKIFKLKYGNHVIQFKVDWKSSKPLEFTLTNNNSDINIKCSCYSKLGITYSVIKSYLIPNDEYIKVAIK